MLHIEKLISLLWTSHVCWFDWHVPPNMPIVFYSVSFYRLLYDSQETFNRKMTPNATTIRYAWLFDYFLLSLKETTQRPEVIFTVRLLDIVTRDSLSRFKQTLCHMMSVCLQRSLRMRTALEGALKVHSYIRLYTGKYAFTPPWLKSRTY